MSYIISTSVRTIAAQTMDARNMNVPSRVSISYDSSTATMTITTGTHEK